MKCVVAFACLLAVASAGYINSPAVYGGAYAAYGGAYDDGSYRGEGLYEGAYKGEGVYESQGYVAPIVAARAYAGPFAHAYAAPAFGLASEARLVDPVAVAAGAPLPTGDTVEVAAAKAAHFQAHAAAKGQVYGAPVVAARAYAAPIAHAYAAPIAHAYAAPAFGLASEARLVDPVAIAAGAPLPTGDTVEVAAAKASHFQAHAAAKGLAYGAPVTTYAHGYAAPIAHGYAHAGHVVSEARLVDPVAIAAGAPLPTGDTVEVAAAKAAHYAAHHEAKVNHFHSKGHLIAKRSPQYLSTYGAPLRTYGYSGLVSPLGYSGYTGYGYGRLGFY